MRQLLNTLFVTSEDIYLSLDGENVVANRGGEAVARYPLHTLQSIVSFSYAGASPALMGACAQREVGLAFCSPRGKFLARVAGQAQGNVLLRRMQYRVADDPSQSCRVAGMMIFGKVYNAKWSVERTRRDMPCASTKRTFQLCLTSYRGFCRKSQRRRRSTVCAASRVSVRRHISACWTT